MVVRGGPALGWGRERWRRAYFACALALFVGVPVQFFLAGLGLLHDARFLDWHMWFVHVLEVLPFLLVAMALLGRAPARLVVLPLVVVVLIGLQYGFIRAPAGWLRALHVVNGLAIFAVAHATCGWSRRRSSTATVAGLYGERAEGVPGRLPTR